MNSNIKDVFRIYIRTQRHNHKNIIWTAILQFGSDYAKTDSLVIPLNFALNKHRADLYAVYDCICRYTPVASNVHIYINNSELAFEWNEEHEKDHEFCKSTLDQDLWQKLIYMAKRKRLKIDFFDKNSILTGISITEGEEE